MPANILIADDHDDNRELLQLLLLNAGYDVREAKDGSECLAIARKAQTSAPAVKRKLDIGVSFARTVPETNTVEMAGICDVPEHN